jgi:hypothetical protein
MEIRRVCEWCGKEFTAQTVKTQYCSKLCNNRAYKHRKRQECIELTICNSRKKLEEIRENQIPEIMTAGLAAMYIGVHFLLRVNTTQNLLKLHARDILVKN